MGRFGYVIYFRETDYEDAARALAAVALTDTHRCLREAGVGIYASSGVTDGVGRFGSIYFRETDYEDAARTLAAVALKA